MASVDLNRRAKLTLARVLPVELQSDDGFDRWFEPLKRRIQIAAQKVEDADQAILTAEQHRIQSNERCKRTVYDVFKGGGSLTKSSASIRSKIGRQLLDGNHCRGVLSKMQVKNRILRFPDLGRFRILCSLSSDVEQALRVLLDARKRRLAGHYPLVSPVKDYVEDLSLRCPSRGHRARQFAVHVRTGHAAEVVHVEIQLMTTVQHAWDQRNHPIYEWVREGAVLPDNLVIRDVALAETLYLVDEQASRNWKDILDHRKEKSLS